MLAITDVETLKRGVESLRQSIELGLRPGTKSTMSPQARRAIKSEIERCIQHLDELRDRLSG